MRALVLILLLCLAPVAGAQWYKWVDEDDTVSYSDKAEPGAQQIEEVRIQTYKAPKPSGSSAARSGGAGESTGDEATDASIYSKIRIVNPEDDEAIRDSVGRVTIHISLVPALHAAEGHTVSILLDGKVVIADQKTTRYQLTNVDRGTHSVQAQVRDAESAVIASSELVTFHLQRQSVQANNPNTAFPRTNSMIPKEFLSPSQPFAQPPATSR